MGQILLDSLAQHWLFKALDKIELSNLSQKFITRKFDVGQFVFHQQDPADRLYVVLSGRISIETITLSGKTTKIAQLKPGEIFGELALIDEGKRSASACVVQSATLASLSRPVFNLLLRDNPDFVRQILAVLVERLRKTNDKVESLVTLSVLQRTAQLLLKMSLVDGETIAITQKELSERLFASREKVNGKLKVLERSGAILISHGKIRIESRERLANCLETDDLV